MIAFINPLNVHKAHATLCRLSKIIRMVLFRMNLEFYFQCNFFFGGAIS